MFKCHNSEEYYYYLPHRYHLKGQVCSNDSHFYQACDTRMLGYEIISNTNRERCGNWLCESVHDDGDPRKILSLYKYNHNGWVCNTRKDCADNIAQRQQQRYAVE